jgi:hypothetical protein
MAHRENDPLDRFLILFALVEPGEPALVLADQLRIECRGPVARDRQLNRPRIRQHRLAAIAVAAVAALVTGKMVIHLRLQHSFRQRLLQLVKQPVLVKGCLRVATGQ